MLSGYQSFDDEGNDITPMCHEADGIDLDDGCGRCVMQDGCPGYYDGCFEAVNGTKHYMTSEYDDRMMACPFCHSSAELLWVEFYDGDTWYRPQCSECNCGWKENYPTKDEAVAAWNENLNKP